MNQIQLAYEIAKRELGVKEISGLQNEQRILDYHRATTLKAESDEVPWCSSFVNYCMLVAGICIAPIYYLAQLKSAGYSESDLIFFSDQANQLHIEFLDVFPYPKRFLTGTPIVPTKSALARHWLEWGVGTKEPREGDLVILNRKSAQKGSAHVGFFVKRNPAIVTLLGGNQGDAVSYKDFLRLRVLGYRTLS